MVDLEISYLSAEEISKFYGAKEFSPVDVVKNSLERIEEVNPKVNCFCFVYPEEAMRQARAAEKALMKSDSNAPALSGIPIAIKDFTPTKGKVTTRGSRLLSDWVPTENPVIVDRMMKAGAILVGKTTTPEFATSSFTDSPLWGITRNPWKLECTSGGSSGGSASAVAAGCVALAEGTDMGGSVRIPAAACGVVGLKPSLGRIPMDIINNCFDSISHFGPLSRTVTGAKTFLEATQGEHPNDIQSLPRCDLSDCLTKSVRGLKIALNVDLGFYDVHPAVEANLREVADALRDSGAEVTEIDLDWDISIVNDWNGSWAVFMAAAYAQMTDVPLSENHFRMSKNLVSLIEEGQSISAATARSWEFRRTIQWQKLGAILSEHHALLCPTNAIPAPSADLGDTDFASLNDAGKLFSFDMTSPFNYTGQCPVLSVPSGFHNGLPTGVQIVARKWDDALALRIGATVEKVMPWNSQRPPI